MKPALIADLSGGIVIIAAVVGVLRAIFRQISSVEMLTEKVADLSGTVREVVDGTLNDHEARIRVLEDRGKRNAEDRG